MTSETYYTPPQSTPFSPIQIAWSVLKGWRLIVLGTILAVLVTIYSLRGTPSVYSAQMQVTAPQNTNDDSKSSGVANALGGLASLANIALPSGGGQSASQFRLYVDSLSSRDLADELAKNPALMHYLFAGEWDAASQTWQEPPQATLEPYKMWLREVLGLSPPQPWHAPNGEDLQVFMGLNLEVLENPRKQYLVRVVFHSTDRRFATEFLTLVSHTADNLLRQKALTRTRNYIDYLSGKLSTVTLAEHRLAIAQALSEQEKYAMVASSGSPFAAEVFEHPWANTLADSPRPGKSLVTALIVGAGLGAALAFVLAQFGGPFYRRLNGTTWWPRVPRFLRHFIQP